MGGCRKPAQASPALAYESVQQLFLTGQLPAAQLDAHKAAAQFSDAGPEWVWKFRLVEAKALVWQGKYDSALALLSAPLPATLAKGSLAIDRDLDQAIAWARLGQLSHSTQAFNDAKLLIDENPSLLRAEFLNTQGLLDMRRGDVSKAEADFQEGLELAKRQGDRFWEASILLNLGAVSRRLEHYDEALYWNRAASSLARTISAQFTLGVALGNEGWDYYQLGDFERSLATSQEAVTQAERQGFALDQVRWLNNSGQAFYQLSRLKDAETVYRKSLAIAETIQNQEEIANAHTALSFLLIDEGQDAAAAVEVDRALRAIRSQDDKPDELILLLARALIATHQSRFTDAESTLKSIYASPSTTPSLRWEVENAFANLYAKQNNSTQAETWYRKSIDTFERQRLSVQPGENRLPFFGNADQLYADYIGFLVSRGRQEQALIILDESRARTLREGLKTSLTRKSSDKANFERAQNQRSYGIAPKAIARALNGIVLEYSLREKHSYLWAINGDKILLYELPGRAEIESHVKDYQRSILNSTDVLAKKDEAGLWLHEKLVAPATAMIPPGSRVFLIPDGSLNNVNFETFLVAAPQPHFWIEDVTLTSADSLQLLQSFHQHVPVKSSPKLLLIGDPISTSTEFADLPNAPAELKSVAAHFLPASRTVLTHGEASPAAYGASHPDQFTYIHFVAHGVANHLSPLDSAVLLSPASTRPDSFKLYARDIVQQPLHAELVTISTCYGSGTKSYAGEGLVGLSWAFLGAGAHNVIGAMWAVSDASTPALMNDMYGNLEKGSQPDVALRAAKLSLAHSAGVYRKPLYWGAFQLYAGS